MPAIIKKPSARLVALARELKRLREQAGLTPSEVYERLGLSQSTFSRIESASTAIPAKLVEHLLDIYGVIGSDKDELIQTARDAPHRGWWQSPRYKNLFPFGYPGLEYEASDISSFELSQVPGLLQTSDYYRALLDVAKEDGLSPDAVELLVEARLARQAIITRPNPPTLRFVISQSALCWMVGGESVMKSQVQRLWDESRRPNVSVRILPFSVGAHASMDGSFTLLRFAKYDIEMVHTEGPGGSVYLESAPDLERINVRWRDIVKDALSPSESEEMLMQLLR